MCCIVVGTSVIIQYDFKKHLFVAASIALCGIDIGGFLSPIILERLLTSFDFSTVFLLLASLMAMFSVLTIIFKPVKLSEETISIKMNGSKPSRDEKDHSILKERPMLDTTVLKSPPILIIYVASMVLHFLGNF